MRTNKESRMKQKGIFIRLSEEDKKAVEKDAMRLGLSVTAFIRLLYKQWTDGIRFERDKGYDQHQTIQK